MAWSPRDSTERPSDAPVARQSIHAAEKRNWSSPSIISAITESRSGQRRFSARIIDVSIGSSRIVASAITPVRPSAPAVPQNSSGSDSGVTVTVPLGVCSTNDSTWLEKLPST